MYKIKKLPDGKWQEYPSVTQILGELSSGDGLIQWACNLAVENNDKFAWKQTRDDTADIGSEFHKLVETYINIRLNNKDESDFLNYVSMLDFSLKTMFYQFYNWQNKNVKKFLESEKPVCNEKEAYAGTLDFCYETHNNELVCVDIKTSSSIYKKHEIQAVAYLYARNSMHGRYDIECLHDNKQWQETHDYNKIELKKAAVLRISQKNFDLEYKEVKNKISYIVAFEGLLKYYYHSAKRRLKNRRAG